MKYHSESCLREKVTRLALTDLQWKKTSARFAFQTTEQRFRLSWFSAICSGSLVTYCPKIPDVHWMVYAKDAAYRRPPHSGKGCRNRSLLPYLFN